MIRQCAWCQRPLGESAPLGDKSVTHGVCQECERMLLDQCRVPVSDGADEMPEALAPAEVIQ
jgi:hypothetical protein